MIYLATRPRQGLGLGQYGGRTRPLDPKIDTAFTIASAALSGNDPNAPQAFAYLRRIIGAPPLFKPSETKPGQLGDLNPYLAKAAWAIENPIYTGLLVLGIPALAFFLGRMSVRR